jgi:CheY-like chemotaxis protein
MLRSTDTFEFRILIVDDQQSNVRLLEFALQRAGYLAVSSTTEPRSVSELHRQNRYDLILLDLQMPGMNGFEVLEDLKTVDRSMVSVLVLSADPEKRKRAIDGGARSFLSKPFVLTEVLHEVQLMLAEVLEFRNRIIPAA